MNKSEYLMACLSEEASEIIKATQKAQRFGLDNGNPFDKDFISNRDAIVHEIIDLLAIALMMESNGDIHVSQFIDSTCITEELCNKMSKVLTFMNESERVGALHK